MTAAPVATATRVLAASCVVPGYTGEHPDVAAAEPPDVTGFVVSRFGPLLLDAARRCLGEPGSDLLAGRGARTALVLGSVFGDAASLDVAAEQLAAGRAPDPLLCYQAVPTSAMGQLSHDYAITGPLTCVSTEGYPSRELLDVADLLLASDEADLVVLAAVELAPTARVAHLADATNPPRDAAVCLLLGRGPSDVDKTSPVPAGLGPLGGLVSLVSPLHRTNRG